MSVSESSNSSTPVAENNTNEARALIEGEDYYLEGKILVFTASYHLRRGYCCGNGCRHCPYR
jgi:hypothetical protein